MRNDKQELENLVNQMWQERNYQGISDLLNQLLDVKTEFEQYKRESVKWSVEDFLGRAEDLNYELTDEQAQDALEDMIRKHDCTIGITWDTVDFWVDYYGTKK